LYIPPPEFPSNTQLVTVGEPPVLYIPPPEEAEFPVNTQLVTVGAEEELYIPPPLPRSPLSRACPPVMVKPSKVVLFAPTTTCRAVAPSMMVSLSSQFR
jgi:hypothetical protein